MTCNCTSIFGHYQIILANTSRKLKQFWKFALFQAFNLRLTWLEGFFGGRILSTVHHYKWNVNRFYILLIWREYLGKIVLFEHTTYLCSSPRNLRVQYQSTWGPHQICKKREKTSLDMRLKNISTRTFLRIAHSLFKSL